MFETSSDSSEGCERVLSAETPVANGLAPTWHRETTNALRL